MAVYTAVDHLLGLLFNKRSQKIRVYTYPIVLKFDWHIGSSLISEQCDQYNIQSHGYDTSRNSAVRRLSA